MLRRILLLPVIGILAACGQPGLTASPTPPSVTTAPPTATAPAPTRVVPTPTSGAQAVVTPIRVDLTPAQRAAMQALATAVNVPVDQIKLISTAAVQWPDGCLGIVRLGVMCIQGSVDGFRIILEAGGKQYEYHTNQDGTAVQRLLKESPFVSIVVRAPDNSIQVINTQVPVDPRPVAITTGLLPQAGVVSGTIYALDFANQPRAVAVDATGTRTLDFVKNPNYGLAVQSGAAGAGAHLGWATSPIGEGTPSQLFASAPDGSGLTTLFTDTTTITAPRQLLAERWSRDGQSLYFSKEPYGIGGYILFAGASSLYRVNLQDHSVQEVIPFNANGGKMICIDDLSADERLTVDHCARTSITIQDLSSGLTTTIQAPADVTGFKFVGSGRFNPDLTRVAFALAKGDPGAEQGWVAVSDSLKGASKLIVTGKPGEYFTVAGWLNSDTLLLQSNALTCNPACTNTLWTVRTDGSGLNKVADGTFLTIVNQ